MTFTPDALDVAATQTPSALHLGHRHVLRALYDGNAPGEYIRCERIGGRRSGRIATRAYDVISEPGAVLLKILDPTVRKNTVLTE